MITLLFYLVGSFLSFIFKFEIEVCIPFYEGCLPYLNERDSEVIINANSGAGKVGFTNLSFYCTSKFGLGGLNENLVFEAP